MNKSYINALLKHKRVGLLIKLIKNNEYVWSVSDFQYIFDKCIKHKLYDIFYFFMEIFNNRSCIDFIDNNKYHTYYEKHNINKVFIWACRNGHIKIIEYFLFPEIQERYPNIDPSANNNGGFRYACMNGHKEIVEYLLSKDIQERYPNIDPSASNNQGFKWACQNGHKEIVEYLLSENIKKRFPQLHPNNLDSELIENIEKCIGYSIQ